MTSHEFKPEQSILYLVATPIGNLSDLSQRAIETLNKVDWIAAEDTRNSRRLFSATGQEKPLHSCHENSSPEKISQLVSRLKSGETGAYVSDAGTPGLSDPGAKLVSAAREEGIKIIPIPGPSAVTAILSVAGFSTSSFSFHGFFPRKKGERQGFLARLARLGGVHIFFESPERFSSAIAEIAAFRPELQLVIGRELTKKFEEVEAGKAEALSLAWKDREPRGEFVIACEFPAAEEEAKLPTESEVRVLLQELKSAGVGQKLLTRTGVALGLSRRDAYNQGLQSRENSND